MKKNTLIFLLFSLVLTATSGISVRSHAGPTSLPAHAVMIDEQRYFFPVAVTVRPRGEKRQTVTVTLRVGSDFGLGKGFNWPSNWTLGSTNRYYFNLVAEGQEIRPIAQTNVLSVLDSGTSRNVEIVFAVDNDVNIRDLNIRFVGRNKKQREAHQESTPIAPFIRSS